MSTETIAETISYPDAFVEMEPVRTVRAVVTTATRISVLIEPGKPSIFFTESVDAEVLEYPDGGVRVTPDATSAYELPAEQRVR